MKRSLEDKEFEVVKLKADLDKETKRMFRYLIDNDNEQGISGTIYTPKKDGNKRKPQKRLQIKIKLEV